MSDFAERLVSCLIRCGRKEKYARLFASRISFGDGCWNWNGYLSRKGYGVASQTINGVQRDMFAHRVTYESMVAVVPQGMCIDHLCRNRKCVNPSHMEVVTVGENVLRGVGFSAVHKRKTHCKHGHELTGDNVYRGSAFRSNGYRICVTCTKERTKKYYWQAKAARSMS